MQRQHDQQVAARYTLRNELFALDYKSSNLPRGAPPATQTLIASLPAGQKKDFDAVVIVGQDKSQ